MVNSQIYQFDLVHLGSDHDCEGPQGELIDPVEDAREGDVLDHLREGLGDGILEAFAGSHGWMPLLLKLKKQWALGGPSGSHPRMSNMRRIIGTVTEWVQPEALVGGVYDAGVNRC